MPRAWAWVHWMLQDGGALRAVLRQYLADLRRQERPELLLPRLQRAVGDPAPALLAHVRGLVQAGR